MQQKEIIIINKLGLHARPSAQLAKAANLYQSSITISHGKRTVDAKSILGLMTMALPCGTTLTIRADGPDEEAAVTHLSELFENRFGEDQ